ncbi:MAG: DUF998 domain-containing protein [Dehalococcoidia bacterium]|nr:DUF998 domain-containing protein [Dehalococcoidia bacterium]
MSENTSIESFAEVNSGRWHRRAVARAGLVAVILSVAVYGVGDLLSGLLYDGYSFRDQGISELTAFGSPVRPLMVTVILAHGLLGIAFAVGLWRIADRKSLRWIAPLLIITGLLGVPTHTVFAMSSRGMEGGFNDIGHIILTNVFTLLITAAIVLSAVAYRGWFRLYAVGTLVILFGFGAAAWVAIQGIEQNHTPGAGAFERINAYTTFAWLIVLAVTVMRRSPGVATAEPSASSVEAKEPARATSA